jgi:hypothetical protein
MATARPSSPGCANRLSATMVSPAHSQLWPRMLTVLFAEMVTYMKVSQHDSSTHSSSQTDSFAGSRLGMPDHIRSYSSRRPQKQAPLRSELTHSRSPVNSPLTSATFCPSPTRTSSVPGAPRGASSPRSSRKRSPRAPRSTSAPSATTARRSRPSSRRSARMCSTSSTTPLSPRPSLASPRSSTTRCAYTAPLAACPELTTTQEGRLPPLPCRVRLR